MSLHTAQQMVRDFHEKFRCPIGNWGHPKFSDNELRVKLITEEYEELLKAIETEDFEEAIDALGDLLYLILGTAVTWGVNLDPFFEAIHGANMRKSLGARRGDGKIQKPRGWKPPEIGEILKAQKRKFSSR